MVNAVLLSTKELKVFAVIFWAINLYLFVLQCPKPKHQKNVFVVTLFLHQVPQFLLPSQVCAIISERLYIQGVTEYDRHTSSVDRISKIKRKC